MGLDLANTKSEDVGEWRELVYGTVTDMLQGSRRCLAPAHYLYLPKSFQRVFERNLTIVVGETGTGKTYLQDALLSEEHRKVMGVLYPDIRVDERTQVFQGYSEKPDPHSILSRREIEDLLTHSSPYNIWRCVLVNAARRILNRPWGEVYTDWSSRVGWSKFEEAGELIDEASKLSPDGIYILFDDLEHLGSFMPMMLKGLLDLARDARVRWGNIHLRVFMRPDQFERLRTGNDLQAMTISWTLPNLHGLLWSALVNNPSRGRFIRETFGSTEVWGVWKPHADLIFDESVQRGAFHTLTGLYREDGNPRRGQVFDYLPTVLGDTFRHYTPRSFLAMIRAAVRASINEAADTKHVISFKALANEGDLAASRERVGDLALRHGDAAWLMRSLKIKSTPTPHELEDALIPARDTLGIHPSLVITRLTKLGLLRETKTKSLYYEIPHVYLLGFRIGRYEGLSDRGARFKVEEDAES